MRAAFGNHAHCFGLLRMTFGAGQDAVTKFVFVHASDESGQFSKVQRGKALVMEPEMDAAIRRFAPFSAKVRIHSKEECTVESLVENLRSAVCVGVEKLTMDNFQLAPEQHRNQRPENHENEQKRRQTMEHVERMEPPTPRSGAVLPEPEVVPAEQQWQATRQRKRLKLWSRGDMVEIFSKKNQKWFLDAEITDVVYEGGIRDGFRVAAGSMKVVYDNGSRFKWVGPNEMEELLRASPRPRPPKPLVGNLRKESHYFFVTEWTQQHMEVNMGFLLWWPSKDEARSGKAPSGSVYLLGLRQQDSGAYFQLRAESTHGAVFSFQADSAERSAEWVRSLRAHAAYCEEVRQLQEAKDAGTEVCNELLSVLMRRELLSVAAIASAKKRHISSAPSSGAFAHDGKPSGNGPSRSRARSRGGA